MNCWAVAVVSGITYACISILQVHGERAYPFCCSLHDRSYYDYKNAVFPPPGIPIKPPENYLLIRRLGTGKFSDVFEAQDRELEKVIQSGRSSFATTTLPVDIDSRSLVVLKCLKPVSIQKIKRELLILQHASQLPNLTRLLAIVVPPEYYSSSQAPTTPIALINTTSQSALSQSLISPAKATKTRQQAMPTLVLEHAHGDWFCHPNYKNAPSEPSEKDSSTFLSEDEIRYFMYHLLIALDSLHACGIMHRDVKPRNVLINRIHKTLVLIDLGLADFYFSSHDPNNSNKYNVRVASRHYKSPELLLNYQQYGTAIDLWGVGCILAGLLLRKEPFFRGRDNLDQLSTIVEVLGTANLHLYMAKYDIEMTPEIRQVIAQMTLQGRGAPKPWSAFLNSSSSYFPSRESLDLLSQLLQYDHDLRLTAKEAMLHTFFDPVRLEIEIELQKKTITLPWELSSSAEFPGTFQK